MRKLPKHPDLIEPYRVTGADAFQLRRFNPADTQGLHLKKKADKLLVLERND